MKTWLVGLGAALSALVLAGAAIASQSPPDLTDTVAEVEQAQQGASTAEANQAAAAEKAAAGRAHAAAQSDVAKAAHKAEHRAAKARAKKAKQAHAEGAGTDEAFGQVRKAEVHAAKAAGDPIEPAWKNPAHPTGGPEGASAGGSAQAQEHAKPGAGKSEAGKARAPEH